jgi:hypothetical protein
MHKYLNISHVLVLFYFSASQDVFLFSETILISIPL